MDYSQYSFHEAEVLNFKMINNCIYLELEDVTTPDNTKINGTLTFKNITSIKIDNLISNNIKMYFSEGEVICLDKEESGVMLIIEWHHYHPATTKIMSYFISAETVKWVITT